MHSPVKSNAKKTRKSTFNQATVLQSDVGEFQGGYFMMPDPTLTPTKEHDYPLKSNKNSHMQHKLSERSPARRKSTPGDYTAPLSPYKERSSKVDSNQDLKKPHTIAIEINKLLVPGSLAAPIPSYCPESPSKLKDCLSTSPYASGRWAGPAFGNAPHPSTLPLPEFPMFPPQTPTKHTPQQSVTPLDAFLSSSPPYGSSIPVVPFPYVASHVPVYAPAPVPMHTNSLAQLSTDLRRLLNINGAPDVVETVLVSASSS